jgi:phage portal protein BeeE
MNFIEKVTGSWKRLFGNNGGFNWGQTYMLGQKGAVWIDVERPYEVYNTIPQLKTVIDRKASMFSNMDIKLMDLKSGKEIESEELQKLLHNPNVLNGQNDFLKEYKVQEQVYGNQFIYKNSPSKVAAYPVALWNVSPRYLRPVLTGKVFDQIRKEDIISGYEYSQEGQTRTFLTSDILFSKIKDLDNPILGRSPIVSIQFPLSNTKLAYEYRNVLMKERGALGFITGDASDSAGAIPMTPERRKEIEDQYVSDYGIGEGQSRVKIMPMAVKWQATTFPTKEMMLFEEVDANLLTIVDHFGLNINIFSSKNATFENVRQSILQCYQDTIIPEADSFTQNLGKFLNIPEGTRLIASFDHLSIMKENKQKGMAAVESIVRSLNQAVASGILQAPQAQRILQNELGTHLSEV